MGWLLFLLAIPGIWVAWQIIKIIIGAATPPIHQARNVLLHYLKPTGIGPMQIGEPALMALASEVADIADAFARARQTGRAEEIFSVARPYAEQIAWIARNPSVELGGGQDNRVRNLLVEHKSPLID